MTRVLIISNDRVGERMAGPGIRCWEFAKALSHTNEVTLAVPNEAPPSHPDFKICAYDPTGRPLRVLARENEVLVVQGFALYRFPFLMFQARFIVVDIYDPFILESLEVHSQKKATISMAIHQSDLSVLNQQLGKGDFFICASEKQRDYWLGMLSANGRINPLSYQVDSTLRKLIDVVPFGLSSEAPKHTRQVLKGVHSDISESDRVILWGGGIWEWFDPLTLIRAVGEIAQVRDDVKLFFLGTQLGGRSVPKMEMVSKAVQLSKELALYERFVFFNEWVPYEERHNYLLEADIGASLHFDTIEARFSFRTRILDYVWAGLPMVVTRGDWAGELVEKYGLGRTVDYQDAAGTAKTLMQMLETPNLHHVYRPNFERVASQFTWERVIEPLARYCQNPWMALDRTPGAAPKAVPVVAQPQATVQFKPWRVLVSEGWTTLIKEGPRALWARVISYYRWRWMLWRAR